MKYKDVISVKSMLVTAWLVVREDGSQALLVWHKDATIEEVVQSERNLRHHSKVIRIDAGEFFVLSKGQSWIGGDARWLGTDGELYLDSKPLSLSRGVRYGVGSREGMTAGPYKSVVEALEFEPDSEGLYIFRLDGKSSLPLYRWREGNWRKLKGKK